VGEVIVAVGGAPTVMLITGESVWVVPSDTVSRAVYCPACTYVCTGLAAVDVSPSPNVHAYVSVSFSGSDVPALEKFTVSGDGPAVGFAVALTIGAWLPEM